MEFFFPEYRLDWFGSGPSSPNKTGSLFAILFIVSWWPVLRFRWCFWLSLPLATVAAGLLLQTESRGALVGAGLASLLLVVFWFSGRTSCGTHFEASHYVLSWRTVSLVVATILLGLYAQKLGVNDRMVTMTTGEDESANVRVALYSAGFQMIAAAPLGWGYGQAGDAYGQWYQEIGDTRSYLSLVNSHLTWIVEGGIFFQLLYIFGWCFVFMLCWPVPWTPLRGVAAACWLVLGICGSLSSVLTLIWLWVLPLILLLFVIVQRYQFKDWPRRIDYMRTAGGTMSIVLVLNAVSYVMSLGSTITVDDRIIKIGCDPQSVLLYIPDLKVLGNKYGHTIRESLSYVPGYTLLYEPASLEKLDILNYDTLLLSGSSVPLHSIEDFSGELYLLNPNLEIADDLTALYDKRVTVVVGSLGDWRRNRIWESVVAERPNWKFIQLSGVGNFIPNWPQYLNTEENI